MFKPACFWIAPLAVILATATLSPTPTWSLIRTRRRPRSPQRIRRPRGGEDNGHRSGVGVRGHNAITARYPASRMKVGAAPGASVDAAVAAATRTALLLMPTQQAAIEAAYQEALRLIPDGGAKVMASPVGEQQRSPSLTRARTTAPWRPIRTPLHNGRCLCADSVAGATALGQAASLGDDQRSPVSPGAAAQSDQRGVEARLG